ncbi:hypothetical protein ABZ646_26660, partial [Streptomyces sp. NPDC007162]|uniref:hypothetical protein n=1 Tax=Streptomyces sp. NPDC007162 TaxID=3156917 RepID=UPI0033DF1308
MISTRRIVAAVGLAVGVTGLAAPLANAADASPQHPGKLTALGVLDSVATSDVPAKYRGAVRRVRRRVRRVAPPGQEGRRLAVRPRRG